MCLRIAAQVKYRMDLNAGSAAVGAGAWPGTRQHIVVPCSDRYLIGTAGALLSFFLFCASSGFEPEGRGRGCQANCLLGLCRISRTEFKNLHHPASQRFFNQPRCFALEGRANGGAGWQSGEGGGGVARSGPGSAVNRLKNLRPPWQIDEGVHLYMMNS